jgi:hypothetical protein
MLLLKIFGLIVASLAGPLCFYLYYQHKQNQLSDDMELPRNCDTFNVSSVPTNVSALPEIQKHLSNFTIYDNETGYLDPFFLEELIFAVPELIFPEYEQLQTEYKDLRRKFATYIEVYIKLYYDFGGCLSDMLENSLYEVLKLMKIPAKVFEDSWRYYAKLSKDAGDSKVESLWWPYMNSVLGVKSKKNELTYDQKIKGLECINEKMPKMLDKFREYERVIYDTTILSGLVTKQAVDACNKKNGIEEEDIISEEAVLKEVNHEDFEESDMRDLIIEHFTLQQKINDDGFHAFPKKSSEL